VSIAVRKRPRFLLDLAGELTWLNDKTGAEVAEWWYEALLGTIDFIGKNSMVGRERKDLSQVGIRSWRVPDLSRWLIFYAVTAKKEVVFYRIRSGTMNLVVMNMES
jgi:plasmid stabilization system protein ParE